MNSSGKAARTVARGRSVVVASALLVLATGFPSVRTIAETNVADTAATEQGDERTSPLRPTWIVPRRSGGDSGADEVVGIDTGDAATADVGENDISTSVAAVSGKADDPDQSDLTGVSGTPASRREDRDWRLQSRIVIHGTAEAERLSDLVAGLLTDLGALDVEQREVDVVVEQDHIRYFREQDASMARELASELDDVFGRVDLRPLTRYRPSPRPGLLELWLR